MAQLLVRNIEQSLKSRLQRRAKRNGHSMEEEARDILRSALRRDQAEEGPLGTRIQRLFEGIGLEEDIPLIRGQEPRPAKFDE
jgi:antitoxin FitA